MKKKSLTRRDFVKRSALTAAVLPLHKISDKAKAAGNSLANLSGTDTAQLIWLDGKAPITTIGATCGVPWPRGSFKKGTALSLHTSSGEAVPVQSWPLAYWPDGSIKWTGHAIGANS